MTIYNSCTSIGIGAPNFFGDATTLEKKRKTVVLEDINLEEVEKKDLIYNFLAVSGIAPSPIILQYPSFSNTFGALLISILSIWVGNATLLMAFVFVSCVNFFTRLFYDTANTFRQKIGNLIADWLLVGVSATLCNVFFKNIGLSIGSYQIPILSLAISLMIANYLISISSFYYQASTLFKSPLFVCLAIAIRDGIETFYESFRKNIEKKITTLE